MSLFNKKKNEASGMAVHVLGGEFNVSYKRSCVGTPRTMRFAPC